MHSNFNGRETRKEKLVFSNGVLSETASLTASLVVWRDSAEVTSGRVPVVFQNAAGAWHWLGMRARVNGEDRITFAGLQRRISCEVLEFKNLGEVSVYVASDFCAPRAVFVAPLPLDTREDALVYFASGFTGALTDTQAARWLKWQGDVGKAQAGLFRNLVCAMRENSAQVVSLREKLNVQFPDRCETLEKRMSWRELSGVIAELEKRVGKLEALLDAMI